MRRGEAFPSTYLGKDDLTDPVLATIADVRLEEIQGDHGRSDKPVMYFQDEDMKHLILNTTNWNTIEAICGEDTEEWAGQRIELYVDPGVVYGGKRVGGVRVRIPSSSRKAKVAPDTDILSWIEAQAVAEAAGIDPDTVIARLKELGRDAYRPSRDTATVRQMIAETEQLPLEDDDDIPF